MHSQSVIINKQGIIKVSLCIVGKMGPVDLSVTKTKDYLSTLKVQHSKLSLRFQFFSSVK